jgi:RNA polymerase sigma-70 factor, ECF subfamily
MARAATTCLYGQEAGYRTPRAIAGEDGLIVAERSKQDSLYEEAARNFGAALARLASAYQADPDKRRDLLQEIHIALWRSFAGFNGACSLRTWVYRVAHNVATSHMVREKRRRAETMVSLEELDRTASAEDSERLAGEREIFARLLAMVRQLKPLDRQVILSYLDGMDAASISEVTGLSESNVAVKVHRIKNILSRKFREGGRDAE